MATITELRAAVASAITAGTSLRCSASWPGAFNPPGAILKRVAGPKRMGMRSAYTVTIEVTVAVPLGSGLEAAQAALDPYTEPEGSCSVMAALEADKTLGGVCDTIKIDDWGKDRDAAIAGAECVMNALNIEILYRI
jgi:hypothetical protein